MTLVGFKRIEFKSYLTATLVVGIAAAILGCGGGGGGGGTSGGGGGYTGLQVSVTYPNDSTQMIDPGTLFVGDTLQLEITGRDKNGVLKSIPVTGWKTTAPVGVASVTNDGILTAVGSSAGTSYTVQTQYGGTTYKTSIAVVAPQNIVTGLVRNLSSYGIQSVKVLAYDASKTLLSTTHTTRIGTFRISVPSTATRFTIDISAADPTGAYYYSQYSYNNGEYLTGTTCLAKLPSPLSSTSATALPSDIVPDSKSLGPPPPPTQCIGP